MTIINGINGANHHTVEDILANIRTSIAEESGPARFVAAEVHYPANLPARREAQFAEEAREFELPAIFKPGHNASPERPKLFGRLSDALKATNGQEGARVRTVIPFDPSASGRMLEPPAELQMAAGNDPAYAPQPQNPAPPAEHGPIRREMPTFFDTRLNKLGELTRQAYQPKEPEPVPQPAHQPAPAPLQHQQVATRQPPMLPEGNLAQHAASSVDDAAAQLLRPMLRQWLQENMPKIVEKALLSEAQGDLPPKPRK
ncbi:MAG: DUF2497 domain-containing protein [Hyphomicrobium sp.]